MIGRFLELSLHAPDVLESIAFWEALGFRQVTTNDVWQHPYAVMSDGRVVLGLHAYRFDHSPALTFVRNDLARHLPSLRAMGIEFEFAKTGDDQFHEAGFLCPDGQMVALLESRTCSPPGFDEQDFSLLGALRHLTLPVRRMDEALPFWARLGMAVLEYDEEHPDTALLSNGPFVMRLDEARARRAPALVFRSPDMEITARHISDRVTEPAWTAAGWLSLESPEGLALLVQPTDLGVRPQTLFGV